MKAINIKRKALAILMSLAMVFTMMPMMGQTAYAYTATLELDGGSYTLTGDNRLVKDGTSGEKINIRPDQDITFKGNTEIKLGGYKLKCHSIKSGFEYPSDPDIGKHPWYSYDLTIDGGDEGGSIQIGDSSMEDYAVAAYDLTIRNLDKDSSVSCLRGWGNKVAIFAKNDLRIEGIKNKFDIYGAIGMEARDGETNISDVSGSMQVNAMSRGIDTDDTNNNTIKISSSNVVIDVQAWDGNCIDSGWKKGGISITDSIVVMSNSNNNEPTSTSKGGYNALSVSEIVNIKDSYVSAMNWQKDRSAMLVYEDTGKLIISGESMVACKNVEGGSASALMANAIELKDGNRLFMPKDGYIGKTIYNGGSDPKEMYTVFDKDGNTSALVGFGSGKELINTISAPSKVLPDTPIRLCGVLRDEDGNPVPAYGINIYCEDSGGEALVQTDAQGRWQYTENDFVFSNPGQGTFSISVHLLGNWEELSVQDLVRYAPPEDAVVNLQVIDSGYAETLYKLELTNPPQGESKKTEYKCGERFDPKASYVKANISCLSAGTGIWLELQDLEPGSTTITPAVLDYGMEEVSITYMFGGNTASIECPITVVHDWSETPLVSWTEDGSKTPGDAGYYTAENVKAKWTCSNEDHDAYEASANAIGVAEVEPTCGAAGKVIYTATFTDPDGGTYTATKEVTTLPATGKHSWDGGRLTKAPTATATGIRTYTCTVCKATRTETIDKLAKKANPLTVKGKTSTVKYSKLKKKAQTISRAKAIIVSGAQGALTYQKASVTYTKAKSDKMSKKALKKYKKQAAKKITINAKTGKVTVKKGLKKGTYKVKVKVMAAGNANYNPSAWRLVTFKIKIK